MKISRSIATVSLLATALSPLVSQAQNRLWGTYVGGFNGDSVNAIALNVSGEIYAVGSTQSSTGIVKPGGFDVVKAQALVGSGFLAKYDTNGKRIWGTFYGDEIKTDSDIGPEAELIDVKLDASGNVYVIGTIKCPSTGLATAGAFQTQCRGKKDMYLAKFSPTGKRIWGTYYGGNGDDIATGLSVNTTGVYLAASTTSSQGVVTSPSPDFSLGGEHDGLVAKFDLNGQKTWSRYYGGEANDAVEDIDCRVNTCFIVGYTESDTGIVTIGANDITRTADDALVARIDGLTGQRVWGTYFGGNFLDGGRNVIVDNALNVYVGGWTNSNEDLASPGAFKPVPGGWMDNFLAKFDGNGVLKNSTYFGEGSSPNTDDEDYLLDMTRDAAGNIYTLAVVRGKEKVPSAFGDQATQNAFDKIIDGVDDAVITKFDASLKRIWATYYGGSGQEMDWQDGGIAIGLGNHVHIGGWTGSPNAMATQGADNGNPKNSDGFLAEFAQ